MEREGNMINEAVAPNDDIDKYLASSDSEDDQRYKWFAIIYLFLHVLSFKTREIINYFGFIIQ